MKQKLKTQDKLKQWDVGGSINLNLMCCGLCKHGPNSHAYLFFECDYSSQVWNMVKPLASLEQNSWDDIVKFLLTNWQSKTAKIVIGKLLVAATTYMIKQERNNRLFSLIERPVNLLRDIIVSTVRLKLATLKFKKRTKGMNILDNWKLPKR
uniref:uncharacterized protein LOC122601289 n=1 Tax=Erigeron canadensis TaxID=72917 RepID=UPI001CB8CA35|nr:uncharacterized protein LOC122601289 [Erigeron canadensis]